MERNWAGNLTYRASRVTYPATLGELQRLVAKSARVRALGSRHSFNDLADTIGLLLSLDALPTDVVIDEGARTVRVGAGIRYGALAAALQERGWALPNLASLPHISVAGAISTATHGSGDANGCLATSVAAIDLVGPDGAARSVARRDEEFAGSVVGLGALGVLTHVTLDLVPTFELRQVAYEGVPWDGVLAGLDDVLASGYSVSVFTSWVGDVMVWVKDPEPPAELLGTQPSTAPVHMVAGESPLAVTTQGGVPGAWLDRLPHFRLDHKPSAGDELQSEYLLPRDHAHAALTGLRELGDRLAPLLYIAEIRSVAADDLWLSGAYGRDTLAVHFTWRQRAEQVAALLPEVEAVLLPLGARPHWGKCFATTDLATCYPRWADFAGLRKRHDPHGKFGNPFLDRLFLA